MIIVSSLGQRKTRWTRTGRNGVVAAVEDEDDENAIEVSEDGIGLKVVEIKT
jgi:hypothetical protein